MDGGLIGERAMPDTDKFDDVSTAIVASASLPATAPLEDWSNAADAFAVSPSARSFAKVKAASHNLANNLREAGVEISPSRLTKSVGDEYEDAEVNDYIRRRYGSRE
jgi:hypothetical protein